jgi:hypothetical protein
VGRDLSGLIVTYGSLVSRITRQGVQIIHQIPNAIIGLDLTESRHSSEADSVPDDPKQLLIGIALHLLAGWEGVSLDTILAGIKTDAHYAFVRSYGDYTTKMPVVDLRNEQAWIAFRFDGEDLAPKHGGCARLNCPPSLFVEECQVDAWHYLMHEDRPGFWELQNREALVGVKPIHVRICHQVSAICLMQGFVEVALLHNPWRR